MFDTTQLSTAGLDRTKNPTLQKLLGEVNLYNALPHDQHAQASRLLDKIMKHAAVYLTSKKPQAGIKNQLRWTAMTALATQAATEAQGHGVKLLHTPADFRAIKGDIKLGCQSYWLERVDPLHRPGFTLSKHYEDWISRPPIAMKEKQSFWEWLGNTGNDSQVMMVKGDDAVLRVVTLHRHRTQQNARTTLTGMLPVWALKRLSSSNIADSLRRNSERIARRPSELCLCGVNI